jgi:hypothetical protein
MSLPELCAIARLARPSLVDVHLNGPDYFVDGVLAAVLAVQTREIHQASTPSTVVAGGY